MCTSIFQCWERRKRLSLLLKKGVANLYRIPFLLQQQNKIHYKVLVLSGTLDDCWLLLGRWYLLLLSCPTERGAERLGSDA